ncbi:MAG TPA: CPBP family intramembrane glutamic endopeptidase [Chloroflexota bacterium]
MRDATTSAAVDGRAHDLVAPRRAVVWFVALAFGLSWPLFLAPLAFGSPGSTGHGVVTGIAWSAAMWGPGVAAIVVTRFVLSRPLGALRLNRLGPKRYYLGAWFIPPLVAAVAGALTLVLGAGQLALSFSTLRSALAQTPGAETAPVSLMVAGQVLAALTLAPLLNVPFALGEELGWRGFLVPALLAARGPGRAVLTSGVIWGVWHAPAIVQGLNYPGQPVLGVPMMVVFCALVGAVFSWLYLRTRSPWAPALAHGSLNASAGLPLLALDDVNLVVGGTAASLIGWLPWAVVVGWLVLSGRLSVAEDETR